MQPKTAVCREFFPLQTLHVAYLQRKIQLSGISAYPDGSPSQLIRISAVLLYITDLHMVYFNVTGLMTIIISSRSLCNVNCQIKHYCQKTGQSDAQCGAFAIIAGRLLCSRVGIIHLCLCIQLPVLCRQRVTSMNQLFVQRILQNIY